MTLRTLDFKHLILLTLLIGACYSLSAFDQSSDYVWYDWTAVKRDYISRRLILESPAAGSNKFTFISSYILEAANESTLVNPLLKLVEDDSLNNRLGFRSSYTVEGKKVILKLSIFDYLVKEEAAALTAEFSDNYGNRIKGAVEKLFRLLNNHLTEYNHKLIEHEEFSYKEGQIFDYPLKIGDRLVIIPIYAGKSTIIFYNTNRESYLLSLKGTNYQAVEGITTFYINKSDMERLSFIYENSKKSIEIKPAPKGQLITYKINMIKEKRPFEGRFYLDIGYYQSSGGYIGGDLIFGLGFKRDFALRDSLYFRGHFSLKLLHILEKDISTVKPTNLRVKWGVGYRHMFYFNSIIGLGIGAEAGFEFYLLKMLYYSIFTFETEDYYIPGFPSFYLSLPIYLELPTFSRVSIFLTIEPTFRVISKVIFYDGYVWRDNFEIDGYSENIFRLTIPQSEPGSPYTAIDLFFNDIPITLGIKIKI